jgi:hypothetical protein
VQGPVSADRLHRVHQYTSTSAFRLKPLGSSCWKLVYDEPLSTFSLSCNLRPYSVNGVVYGGDAVPRGDMPPPVVGDGKRLSGMRGVATVHTLARLESHVINTGPPKPGATLYNLERLYPNDVSPDNV